MLVVRGSVFGGFDVVDLWYLLVREFVSDCVDGMFCVCGFAVPCVVICGAGPSFRFAFVFYVCDFKFWWFDSNLVFGVWVL